MDNESELIDGCVHYIAKGSWMLTVGLSAFALAVFGPRVRNEVQYNVKKANEEEFKGIREEMRKLHASNLELRASNLEMRALLQKVTRQEHNNHHVKHID